MRGTFNKQSWCSLLIVLQQKVEETLRWNHIDYTDIGYRGKTVVVGHTVTKSYLPFIGEHLIALDTGIHRPGGWLTGADLTNGIFWQANAKGEVRELNRS